MALSGVHVLCAYAGSYRRDKNEAILGKFIWSEAPASGVTSTNAAPNIHDVFGQAVYRIRASADSWISIGPAPNATSGTRTYVPANTDVHLFVDGGDKLQWIAA